MADASPSPFLALQHRNFRLLWTGQLISFTGSHMQTAAILWHVSLLVPPDQRPLALGMVGLVRLMPIVFFSIAGGTVADASDRRRVMLYTQSALGLTAAALAVLTFRGVDHPWPIYSLAAIGAAAGAFDSPARQALIPSLVPRDHLPNAISLNAIMLQIVVGRRSGHRRPGHRDARRRVGLCHQRAHVRVRHRRAPHDARRPGANAGADQRHQRARGA